MDIYKYKLHWINWSIEHFIIWIRIRFRLHFMMIFLFKFFTVSKIKLAWHVVPLIWTTKLITIYIHIHTIYIHIHYLYFSFQNSYETRDKKNFHFTFKDLLPFINFFFWLRLTYSVTFCIFNFNTGKLNMISEGLTLYTWSLRIYWVSRNLWKSAANLLVWWTWFTFYTCWLVQFFIPQDNIYRIKI